MRNYDVVFFNGVSSLKKEYLERIKKVNNNIKIFETHQKLLNLNKIKKNRNYLMFSGIGNPSNFKNLLLKNKIKIKKTLIYPDHYNYSLNDLKYIEKLAKKLKLKIITTEKDYLRINNFDKKNIEFMNLVDNLCIKYKALPSIIKDSRITETTVNQCYEYANNFRNDLLKYDKKRIYKSELSDRLAL